MSYYEIHPIRTEAQVAAVEKIQARLYEQYETVDVTHFCIDSVIISAQ